MQEQNTLQNDVNERGSGKYKSEYDSNSQRDA